MEWYRVFYWTAKLGSLTQAAGQLNITQPAVSHTLKHLEASLGSTLFVRTTRGVTLTSDGEALYHYVDQAMRFIEMGEKTMADRHDLLTGEVRIGASDSLCAHYLLPVLETFHRQYPGVRIQVTNRTSPETIGLLKAGSIDFGIVHLPAEDESVEFVKTARQQDVLVGGPKYAELAARPLAIRKLGDWPLLMLEQGASSRSYLDVYARSHGVELKPEIELGSVELLSRFARSGFGLAVVVKDYVRAELAAGSLVEIPLDPPIPARHIGIATLRHLPLPAAARHLSEQLLAVADAE